MHRPTDLHTLLSEIGAHPKKGMSQNFLIDGNILTKIVTSAEVVPGERVLEIGAGPGALTEKLLQAGAYVDAVELDLPFAQALHRLQTLDGRLKVHQGDIMKLDLDRLVGNGPIKVIANLPYRLTTPILTLLLPRYDLLSSLTLMVQDEVAHRLTSLPGHPDYGFSTIFTAFWSEASYLFRVSPNCFYPKPKVYSAMIRMKLRPPPYPVDHDRFLLMVQTAFKQRRKMLRNTLQSLFPDVNLEEMLTETGINPKARAEELTLQDFVHLYSKLDQIAQ